MGQELTGDANVRLLGSSVAPVWIHGNYMLCYRDVSVSFTFLESADEQDVAQERHNGDTEETGQQAHKTTHVEDEPIIHTAADIFKGKLLKNNRE